MRYISVPFLLIKSWMVDRYGISINTCSGVAGIYQRYCFHTKPSQYRQQRILTATEIVGAHSQPVKL